MTVSSDRALSSVLASRADDLVGSIIDSSTTLLAKQQHDVVRLAMGSPGEDLIPVALLDRYAAAAIPDKYGYGASEGEPGLVHRILEQLALSANGDPERITITTGGMQGLDLAYKLFIDPGDVVVVEGPTYTNGTATALSYGARILETPVDEHGMDVDALEDVLARERVVPKAIYTIPNFQNPAGVTLTRERKVRLLELAERWGSIIIDDDPYGLLRFAGETVDSFQDISSNNARVFSVRTFSKILAPGLRLGWVEADPSLHQLLINAKQAMDTCTSVPTQNAIANFLADGHLKRHLAAVCSLYHERKQAMRASVDRYFGDAVRTTDPEGGFFLWLTFTDGTDTAALFEPALAEGVAFIPGPAFSLAGHFQNALRLSFATSSAERIDEGVRRLKCAVDLLDDRGGLR